MPLEIRPCIPSDYPDIVSVENRAWADVESTPILFPGPFPDDTAEFRAQELAKQIQDDPSGRWMKIVDTEAAKPGNGIAFSKWQFFNEKLPGPRQNRHFGEGCNVELCNELFGSLGKIREKHIGKLHCLYLQVLTTDPEHQRRGAAIKMVKWGLDQADALGLPVYVESSERARGVYQRCQFEDLDLYELDMSNYGAKNKFRVWPMMYKPETAR